MTAAAKGAGRLNNWIYICGKRFVGYGTAIK
jgi:hypothetical protein